ncbi:hypothetical protein K491DRAFT_521295 [Lophiostoma macrostomum CBS 122681]|uniref:Uncharacterized protein n=1 Tax=Lophiostoma macrostomum CBS 122681 TaxID=1314788 RepID=A0A6A6T353_9PLEO|nr:hypothetical protein K491DRAFT_521295 [Lophiostoma macrostomum CBS 122681]
MRSHQLRRWEFCSSTTFPSSVPSSRVVEVGRGGASRVKSNAMPFGHAFSQGLRDAGDWVSGDDGDHHELSIISIVNDMRGINHFLNIFHGACMSGALIYINPLALELCKFLTTCFTHCLPLKSGYPNSMSKGRRLLKNRTSQSCMAVATFCSWDRVCCATVGFAL